MNKPITPKDLETNPNISVWELYQYLSQMLKYYALQGYSFDRKAEKSVYSFFDFQIALKICETKDVSPAETHCYLNQIWQSLVYIWAEREINLPKFYEYLQNNSTEEDWYSLDKRSNKGALEHLMDFVGKDKANAFNLALVHISRESNNISGLQYTEEYKSFFGNTPRERTLNYLKHLENYFKNLNDVYEEHYDNSDFPTCKNWNVL